MTAHEKALEAAARAGDAFYETASDDQWHWHYEAAIAAYLASMEEGGFVLVPRDPTEAMLEAGHDEIVIGVETTPNFAIVASEVWDAMLAAAKDA